MADRASEWHDLAEDGVCSFACKGVRRGCIWVAVEEH